MKTFNYSGITTNNLKNIDIGFNDHELIYIGGVSGSGKSSLVFDTIAAISENEYGSLINDNKIDVHYRIKDYHAVLVAATLKQLNFNVNPRPTISTYFGLERHLSFVLSRCTQIPIKSFSFNGSCRCTQCNGLGYVNQVDESLIIDREKKLCEGPFRCWNNVYADFYNQLLHMHCQQEGIDETKRFYDLSKGVQTQLLYGTGTPKYRIAYIANGRRRIKTSAYIGPLVGLESKRKDMFAMNIEKYSKQHTCPSCHGSRIQNSVGQKKVVNNISVSSLLILEFSTVLQVFRQLKAEHRDPVFLHSCDYLIRFLEYCNKLSISYLNLSRSISSLSGGELQRLRLVQLLLGKIENLLIVLDEPTASLDQREASSIIEMIKELAETNTVMVVDHNDKLREVATRRFFLGPGSGSKGGDLISEEEYLNSQRSMVPRLKTSSTISHSITLTSDYIDFRTNLIIYEKTLNGICGPSGIGKTTILRDIFPYQLDNYRYISQKPIRTNRLSTVASYTGIADEIKKYYSKFFKKDKTLFSSKQGGACDKCKGSGDIQIGDYYNEKILVKCDKCDGTGYSKKTLEYKINGKNIYEFMSQDIDSVIASEISVSKKFDATIRLLADLGLGHLVLNQQVCTLSGGENQRIKLSRALGKTRIKIFGLDEPTKGLGKREIGEFVRVIANNISEYGKTFIVADHNTDLLHACTYLNKLVRKGQGVYIINEKEF